MQENQKPIPFNSDCLGVVLAGGLSRRMGEDKAQLRHFSEQQKMLEFSKQILQAAGTSSVIVSGDNYQISDKYQQLGPLAGIYSVIMACQPKALLILPIDLPLITTEMVQQLKTTGELAQKATFFSDNYLPLYLPNNAYSELFFNRTFSQLTRDCKRGPSMKNLIAAIPHQIVTASNESALLNCNTKADWQHAKQLYSQPKK